MPASKAGSVQARVCSNSTPPENVNQEPREISETSRSEEPSLRNLMATTLRVFGLERSRALLGAAEGPAQPRHRGRHVRGIDVVGDAGLVVLDVDPAGLEELARTACELHVHDR